MPRMRSYTPMISLCCFLIQYLVENGRLLLTILTPGRISVRRPRTYPISLSFRQRSPPLMRPGSIHPPGASSFMPLSSDAACTVIVRQTSGYTPPIGEEEDSDTSRLRSLEEFFFVLSFVSMIVLHGKERETCVEGRERAWKIQRPA